MNSLERFVLEYEYQESPSAFRQLMRRVREAIKKRQEKKKAKK